jgi:hypothetical protein
MNYTFSSGMGGIGSVLTGGNFFEGAAIGAMNAGLNHLKHKSGNWLLAKLAAHYGFGGNADYYINCDDLDFSGTARKQLGIPDNLNVGDKLSVNLFDAGINEVSLALGKVRMVYQGNDKFSIMEDQFDFNYEKGGSFKRNAGTFVGGALFGRFFNTPVGTFRPNYLFGGSFSIKFRRTVTIR